MRILLAVAFWDAHLGCVRASVGALLGCAGGLALTTLEKFCSVTFLGVVLRFLAAFSESFLAPLLTSISATFLDATRKAIWPNKYTPITGAGILSYPLYDAPHLALITPPALYPIVFFIPPFE